MRVQLRGDRRVIRDDVISRWIAAEPYLRDAEVERLASELMPDVNRRQLSSSLTRARRRCYLGLWHPDMTLSEVFRTNPPWWARIDILLARRGISEIELCEWSGVSARRLSYYRHHSVGKPRAEDAVMLARAVGLTMEEMWG